MEMKHVDSKQQLRGHIHNLFKKKLDAICAYLEVQLKWGSIRLLKYSAVAQVSLMPKKYGIEWLCVNFQGLNRIVNK